MDRNHIRDYLAGLSEDEFAALTAEARAAEPAPAEKLRAAEHSGDWGAAFRLKTAQLHNLITTKDANGRQPRP